MPIIKSAKLLCRMMHSNSSHFVLICTLHAFLVQPLPGQQPERNAAASTATAKDLGLRFQFRNASWLDVLNWFAEQSSLSLDWKELPEGEFNLSTNGFYTAEEALGLINRHLAPRGFTLLRQDEVAFLVKLDSPLNPTMVPRVAAANLSQRSRYEFVKTSFQLDWILAQAAADEFQPLLSPYGRISAFTATNSIEVIDFAENILHIQKVLEQESSDESQGLLVAEFRLQHAKAVNVLAELRELMGLETPLPRSAAIFMQLRQSQRGGDDRDRNRESSSKDQATAALGANIHLVANERQNSIVANAPPDKIALIRQAVSVLDVESTDASMLFSNETMMKVYPLNGVDPDALEEIFEDLRNIGKLHPDSVFSEDDDTQILFAHASIKDHLTIQSVMDQLARASRTFHVVPLAELNAETVVAAIGQLMGGESDIGGSSDDRYRGRDRDRRNSGEWGGFRVEADSINSRLLLFATESELRQVKTLLASIGEREQSNRVRIVEGSDRESTEAAVKRLKALWPAVQTPALEPGASGDQPTEMRKTPLPDISGEATSSKLRLKEALPQLRLVGLGDLDQPGTSVASSSPKLEDRSTLAVELSSDGNVILRSDDPVAIEEAERILRALLPEKKRYHLIELEHQSPISIEIKVSEALSLGVIPTRGPVAFLSDSVTSSLMVVGATATEFERIEKLAKLFDQPVAPNPESERKPRLFELRFAKAQRVATTLKELYRDLLSPVDSTFSQSRNTSRGRGDEDREDLSGSPTVNSTTPYMGSESTKVSFKGMLSVSVVAESNSVAISAPAFIMTEIAETIAELDSPDTAEVVQVISVGELNPGLLRSALVSGLGSGGGGATNERAGPGQSPASARSNR